MPLGAAAALAAVAVIGPSWTDDDGPQAVARAEFVEVSGDASSVVYVDDKSGWLVVWASAEPGGLGRWWRLPGVSLGSSIKYKTPRALKRGVCRPNSRMGGKSMNSAIANPRFFALIPCAGTGSRAGTDGPKQYQPLAGQPMVMHTLAAFAGVPLRAVPTTPRT